MARAQFVLEFMILLALAVVIGITYFALTTDLLYDTSEQQRFEALNVIGYMVQDEMMLAETVEDGYVREITLPANADRFSYTLANSNRSLTLSSGAITLVYPLPLVNGTLQKGKNILQKDGALWVTAG
jgi:hypothetical protein